MQQQQWQLTDQEFATQVETWNAFLEEHDTIDLTLSVEPCDPPSFIQEDETIPYGPPLSRNRYFVTYEGREIDLTYKQANQVHYWFAIQRSRRARKYAIPLHI